MADPLTPPAARHARTGAKDRGDQVRAAGVVLWRPGQGSDEPELALIHRPKWCDWTFPKGKLKEGERHREAALREALEETGMQVALGSRLPTQHYLVKGRPKRVRYWAAVRVRGAFTANREVDRLEWLPAERARRRLTHSHDRALVDALLKQLCE